MRFSGGGASFSSNDAGFGDCAHSKACIGRILEKFSSLAVWNFRGLKRCLLQLFVGESNDGPYIDLLRAKRHKSLVPSKAFTMADRRSSRFRILGCKPAFTMAEILISLTIIGVIAAITLPALQANINESAWKAQRKALYSRMSQAISLMPSLNGYGDFTGEWADDVVTPTTDTAAERFVTDGLAKVLNINNICSIPMTTTNPADRRKELAKCGIPDNLTNLANSKMPFPTKLSELNPMFTSVYIGTSGTSYSNPQKNIDTSAAAFETKNGESIAVFYNPYCQADTGEMSNSFSQPRMCANFVYDLNGRKGPNKFGKDIGFITALYPVDGEVVAPLPLVKDAAHVSQTMAASACRSQNKNSRVPNIDELTAMFYNREIIGNMPHYYWSSTLNKTDNQKACKQGFTQAGVRQCQVLRDSKDWVRCIER